MSFRHRLLAGGEALALIASVLIAVAASPGSTAGASAPMVTTPWTSLVSAFTAGGVVQLSQDVTDDNSTLALVVGYHKTMELDLNGHHLTVRHAAGNAPGIEVPQGTTLIVEDLPNTGGILTATGGRGGAGIGGEAAVDGRRGVGVGNITIRGGTVNATTGWFGAGIGGGYQGGGGNVTILGGIVTASGKTDGAGIGGGGYQSYGGGEGSGTTTISGGTVTAIGGSNGAGIGSGYYWGDGGNTTISGGSVTAIGGSYGAGIGGGGNSAGHSGGITTISGGSVIATGGTQAAAIGGGVCGGAATTSISGGTVTATGGADAAVIGGGVNCAVVQGGGDGGATTISGTQTLVTIAGKGPAFGPGKGGTAFGSLTNGGLLTLSAGPTTIPQGSSITNTGTITNNGIITNNGTIAGAGTIINKGIIFNTGTIANKGPESPGQSITTNSYTLTFDTSGGDSAAPSALPVYAASIAADNLALPNDPTRTSYIFGGWFTAANGGTHVTAATDLSTIASATGPAQPTLYAHWLTPTTLTASVSAASVPAGTSTTLSFAGLPSGATGSVVFTTGTTNLCTVPDITALTLSCTTPTTLAPGTYPVTATYSGDSHYLGSSATASFIVTGQLATIAVTGPSSIVAGVSGTFTAAGSDQNNNALGEITGQVTFSMTPDGTCTGAVCTADSAGVHTVTATQGTVNGSAPLMVTGAPLATIAVSGPSSFVAGESGTFTAAGSDQYNNSLGDITSGVTFSMAPNGTCTGAVCTAATAGPHIVTATQGAVSGSAPSTVIDAALVATITVAGPPSIVAGGSGTFTATGSDQNGTVLGDITDLVTFTITPDGTCAGAVCTATTADSAGPHTVTATRGAVSGSASLMVNAAALARIAVGGPSSIVAGGSGTFIATGSDQYNNSLGDVTGQVTFSITPDGTCDGAVCTAVTAGAHTVIAAASDGIVSGTASLTVKAASLATITVTGTTSMFTDGSGNFAAAGSDQYSNPLGDVTGQVTFTLTPDGTCTGAVCTAVTAGAHTVTATDGTVSGTASLTVMDAASATITVTGPSSIVAGESVSFTAAGSDQKNNLSGDVTGVVTFTIAPDGTCTGAICTAVTAGAHTVTAAAGMVSGTALLQVNAGALAAITVAGPSSIVAGGSGTFTAAGSDQYKNPLGDITGSVTFSIAPDGTCDGAMCTASIAGAHTVIATQGPLSGTASMMVNAATPATITVAGPSSIIAGEPGTFTAAGIDQYNNPIGGLTAGVVFSMTPEGTCIGAVCTAGTAGAHTVVARQGMVSGSAPLIVIDVDSVVTIAVSGPSSVTAGVAGTFTAAGDDQKNSLLGDITGLVSFTISPDGTCAGAVCTAVTAGPHIVTAAEGNVRGSAPLTVNGAALAAITVTVMGTSPTVAGTSASFTATDRDQYGNSLGDVTNKVMFSMAPDGTCVGAICTAVKAGPHTVTATDGTISGSAPLSVIADALAAITVAGPSSIVAGVSGSFTAAGSDQYKNPLGDVTAGVVFSMTPDGTCTGLICTAVTAGPHVVTATQGRVRGTAPLTVIHAVLATITVAGPSTTVAGGLANFTAVGSDQYKNPFGDLTGSLVFSMTPDGTCAGAVCTAVTAGPHTITATQGNVRGSAPLAVVAAALATISVTGLSAIVAGMPDTFAAVGSDQYKNTLGNITGLVTFTVTGVGSCAGAVCTADTAGLQTVTATQGKVSGVTSLKVTAGAFAAITVAGPSSIVAGVSGSFTAAGSDQYKNPLGDITAGVVFSMTPDGTCTGLICTAVTAGPHVVTATQGRVRGTAPLTVIHAVLATITVAGPSTTVAGGLANFTAVGSDQYKNPFGDLTGSLVFSMTPDGTCAGAVCTAVTAGPHTITATQGNVRGSAPLAVVAAALATITVTGLSAIVAGMPDTFAAVGSDQYKNALGNITGLVTFTVTGVGSCAGAVCTADTAGLQTVTATQGKVSGVTSLKVTAGAFAAITVAGPSSIVAGVSGSFTAAGSDQYKNPLGDITGLVAFTVSGVGSCTGAVCTADTAGPQTVTATKGRVSGIESLTVSAAALATITVAGPSSIVAGVPGIFTAAGSDQYRNPLGDITGLVAFTVSGVGSCTGAVCTADTAGPQTVTATKGKVSGIAPLKVTAAALATITVTGVSSVVTGASATFVAAGRDAYGNPNSAGDHGAVFTVSPRGGRCVGAVCTFTAPGRYTITATEGRVSGSTTITATTITSTMVVAASKAI